jgi:hypothetical protein
VTALLVVALATLGAGPRDDLLHARQLYNQRQYDAAIDAAARARRAPDLADAAALVLARACLERFRQPSNNEADLTTARDALQQVRPARLSASDRLALYIGLGELLYLDDRVAGAAEAFDLALTHLDARDTRERERVLDWWAIALDRQAQVGPDAEQRGIYARIVTRMDDELRRNDESMVAAYWLVAGARGAGDLERAWGAATAVWVRAALSGVEGASLQVDLDQMVRRAIVPERARQLSSDSDARQAAAQMLTEWEALKRRWASP